MTWTITTDGNKTTWTAENGTTNTLTANADRTGWSYDPTDTQPTKGLSK